MVEPFDTIATAGEGTIQGLWFAFWTIVIIAISFISYKAMKHFKNKISWDGPKICRIRIAIMGKYVVEGNLSKNDSLDDEKLEKLKEEGDLKTVVGTIEQLKKESKFFTYNIKFTDDTEAEDEFADRIRIISPVKIESEEYSWLSQKSKRFFESPFEPEQRRNCIWYHTTQKITIKDEDGHDEDWWIASPVPFTEAVKYVSMFDSPFKDAPIHRIDIAKMTNMKNVAELLSASTTLEKYKQANKFLAKQVDDWKKVAEERLEKNNQLNNEKNDLEEELAEKKYVDTGREEKKITVNSFIWAIVGGFASGISALLIPVGFGVRVDAQLLMFGMVGILVGIVFMAIIWKYFVETQKTVKKREVTD